LVQIDLWLTRDGRLVERSWRFREVSRRVQPDQAVEALVREYARRLDRELDAVVGRSEVQLEARSSKLRTEETNRGDFVADALRERLGSDVAVINGGAIRTNRAVPPGPLTRRDVLALLPFTDMVLKLEMRGVDLRAALEHGLAQTDREGGGFLQLSGVRLVWDSRLPAGRRIADVTVGGRPLADETAYTVAVPQLSRPRRRRLHRLRARGKRSSGLRAALRSPRSCSTRSRCAARSRPRSTVASAARRGSGAPCSTGPTSNGISASRGCRSVHRCAIRPAATP
jgi:2',3'-cyclic-nucleotide 2'-phosphodiesterase (5'-nucleotidase family)